MIWLGLTVAVVWSLQHAFPRARANRPLSANSLFLGGVLAMVVVDQIGLTVYYRELKPETLTFACLCIASYGAGALFAGKQSPQNSEIHPINTLVVNGCMLCALVYFLLVADDIPTLLSSSLLELRSAHWQQFGDDRGPLGALTAIARAGAVILVVLLPNFWRERKRQFIYFCGGIVAAIALYIETSATGGRFMFLIFMLAALINHLSLGAKFKPWLIVLIAAGAYYSLAIFPVTRNPYLAGMPMTFFRMVDEVVPAPWIIGMNSGWFRDQMIGLAYSSTYLTVVPYKLQFFTDGLRVQDWYMLGGYNFRYLGFIPSVVGSEAPNFLEARDMIENYSFMAGYGGNPWSMGIRDLLMDFGWVGAIVASGVLGWALTSLSAMTYERKAYLHRALGALAACCGLVFGYLSPFVVTAVLNCMLLLGCTLLMLAIAKAARREGGPSDKHSPIRSYSPPP